MFDIEPGDMKLINTPIDFWGVNYYSRNVVRYRPQDMMGFQSLPPSLETTGRGLVYPQGLCFDAHKGRLRGYPHVHHGEWNGRQTLSKMGEFTMCAG